MDFEYELEPGSVEWEIEQEKRERERSEYGSAREYVRKSEDIFTAKLWDTVRYIALAVAVFFVVRLKFPYLAVDVMLAVSLARPFSRYFSRFKIVTEVVKERTGELEDRFISTSLWFVGAIIGLLLSFFVFMGVKPVTSAWFPAYAIAPDVLQYGVVAFIMAVPVVKNVHDMIACRNITAMKEQDEEAALSYVEYSFDKRKKTNKTWIIVWIIAMLVVMIGQFAFSFVCSFKAETDFDAWKAWQTIEEPDYQLNKEQVQKPIKVQMNGYKGECDVAYSLPYYDGTYHKNVAMVVSYRYSPTSGWVQYNTEAEEEILSMETSGTWTGEWVRQDLIGSTGFDIALRIDLLTFEESRGELAMVNKKTTEKLVGAFTATVTKNENGILIVTATCESPLGMELTLHYNLETNEIESQHLYKGMLSKQGSKTP